MTTIIEESTSQKLAQLQELLGKTGETHYQRIKLAAEILADNEWILNHFGGDTLKAETMLEQRYFADLCGAVTIRRLLLVFRHFPLIEQWKIHHFNFTKMSALADVERKTTKHSRWSVTQKEWEDLEAERDNWKKQAKNEFGQRESLQQENDRLKRQIADLTRDKAKLQGRVEELESLLGTTRKIA
jgi:peptidoglycan hydrolase CwlO-like protein